MYSVLPSPSTRNVPRLVCAVFTVSPLSTGAPVVAGAAVVGASVAAVVAASVAAVVVSGAAAVVAAAAATAVAAVVFTRTRREGLAFTATGATIALAVATLFTELYPRVMVSSTNFSDSLTTTNSSSGHYTLVVISVFTLVLLPVILLYHCWSYHVFLARLGKVEPASSPVELLARSGRGEPTS